MQNISPASVIWPYRTSCNNGSQRKLVAYVHFSHLGDKDKFLPTNHGFDEFFGNLYHLNAEEEPETGFYPKDPAFRKRFGPRGVIHSYADGKIEDTGPLT